MGVVNASAIVLSVCFFFLFVVFVFFLMYRH